MAKKIADNDVEGKKRKDTRNWYKKKGKSDYNNNDRLQKYLSETRDENGAEIIPDGVVSRDKYLDYLKLHDKLMLDPDYYYQTSDPQVVINMMSNHKWIKNQMQHLPEQEQVRIQTISTRLRSLSAKVAFAKKEAFGTVRVGTGRQLSIITNRDHKEFYLERGAEILEYFGRYFTINEVHRIIIQEWGYQIALDSLKRYRADNIDKITERQEEFKRDFGDVRLGYKRSRLDELNYLFLTRRDIYNNGKKLDDSKELRAILEQVRKEVEGDVLTINGNLHVQHEIRVQQQINEQLMKGLNLKSLIISRVAAKLNVDPTLLQYKLVNSYYAKFTGFKEADNHILSDEIIYPSALVYDFDMIKTKNVALLAEEAEIVEEMTEKVTPAVKEKALDIKAMVMKKILENKEMNRKTKASIQTKKDK